METLSAGNRRCSEKDTVEKSTSAARARMKR
jgi:hypothetical protein